MLNHLYLEALDFNEKLTDTKSSLQLYNLLAQSIGMYDCLLIFFSFCFKKFAAAIWARGSVEFLTGAWYKEEREKLLAAVGSNNPLFSHLGA